MRESDATLVRAVLDGDRSAFTRLYDRRGRLVRAICFDASGSLHASADLTQEVFMRAFSALQTLDDPQHFGRWLVGIARQVCREWRRGRGRDERRVEGFARQVGREPAVSPDTPDDAADNAGLYEALRELPEKQRLALHAFYLQDLDAAQAAEILGLSRSGLYHVLSSARHRLRELLQHEDVPR